MSELGEKPIARARANECAGGALRTKVFSGGQVAKAAGAVSGCERGPAKLGPSVAPLVLTVKNTFDNIWRDEDLRPVVTEDFEVYVIDNA